MEVRTMLLISIAEGLNVSHPDRLSTPEVTRIRGLLFIVSLEMLGGGGGGNWRGSGKKNPSGFFPRERFFPPCSRPIYRVTSYTTHRGSVGTHHAMLRMERHGLSTDLSRYPSHRLSHSPWVCSEGYKPPTDLWCQTSYRTSHSLSIPTCHAVDRPVVPHLLRTTRISFCCRWRATDP